MVIAVDFDGTIVEHKFPKIGKERAFAFDILKKLKQDGHQLILWTCRTGSYLNEAVDFCRRNGIEFDAVNDNVPSTFMPKPKIVADLYIDDRQVSGLPPWIEVYYYICSIKS